MLTFETTAIQGVGGIIEKLTVSAHDRETILHSITKSYGCAEPTISKSPTSSFDPGCSTLKRERRYIGLGDGCFAGG